MRASYDELLANLLPVLWRRKRFIFLTAILAVCGAFLVYGVLGSRYQAYTLLRAGQGIKERAAASTNPLGEGLDLASRIDSLSRLAVTDHVIGVAAKQVGYDRLFGEDKPGFIASHFHRLVTEASAVLPELRGWFSSSSRARAEEERSQRIIEQLRPLIAAKQEGRSDLFRITFRHPDPEIAREFVNILGYVLVATQAELIHVPGADAFFQQQAKRLEQEAELAAADLQNFSVAASIYSVADQRALLLKRVSELSVQIGATRGSIEERKGQKQALVDQLLLLRPVTQSKTVTAIVNSLGSRDYRPGSNAAGTIGNFEEAPPLLLVRVYQDAVATLMKTNIELNGLIKLETMLGGELERVNVELAALTSKEAEYDKLKRVLTRASAAADHYGSKVIEEQINLDIAKKSQLSSVRVVQEADRPLSPVFPRIIDLVVLALIGGLAVGCVLVLLPEFARARRQDREDDIERAIVEFRVRSKRDLQAAE